MFPATIFHPTALSAHALPSLVSCNFKRRAKFLDFHTGQRFVEVPSGIEESNKNRGLLKWSIQIPRNICSMRDKGRNRGPLWKGRLLSIEAIQAVQALKFAKGDPRKLEKVFASSISRLLKKDLLSVLTELQRQDQCDLALQVFETVRKEMWYKPDLSLYANIITMLGRNKLIEKVEAILIEMQQEGLRPDTRVCTEIMGSFLQVGMIESAIDTFKLMKQTECHPDKSTFTVLIEGLRALGELEHSEAVRAECMQYLGEPFEVAEDNPQEVVIT